MYFEIDNDYMESLKRRSIFISLIFILNSLFLKALFANVLVSYEQYYMNISSYPGGGKWSGSGLR